MNRILIVEDNSNNRDLLSTILKFQGYETFIAINGEEAVDMVEALQPDLILMDLSMPILDGFEATRQIRGNPATAKVPIVAVSAFDTLQSKEAALEAGCDAFLSKPINMTALKERLDALIGQAR